MNVAAMKYNWFWSFPAYKKDRLYNLDCMYAYFPCVKAVKLCESTQKCDLLWQASGKSDVLFHLVIL